PGLARTLLGDDIGSMVGGIFGGCANTTYGEAVGCVAISGNASTWTILCTAIGCAILSFFTPFVVLIQSIPKCVMGGACIALYGFIAVSGLKMIKNVDLNDNRNLFVVSAILVSGIGGLVWTFGKIQITAVAVALILGIITNAILGGFKAEKETTESMASAYGDFDPDQQQPPKDEE
ncbi:MAG: uracil-xanthine permease, partial [Clostridia bacterium]|nr:uracil-xanthine permease [Clostridia bacterium]